MVEAGHATCKPSVIVTYFREKLEIPDADLDSLALLVTDSPRFLLPLLLEVPSSLELDASFVVLSPCSCAAPLAATLAELFLRENIGILAATAL
jgi:hypothetical protein